LCREERSSDEAGDRGTSEKDEHHRAGRVAEHGLEPWTMGAFDGSDITEVSAHGSGPAGNEVAHRHDRPEAVIAPILGRAWPVLRPLEITEVSHSTLGAACDDTRGLDEYRPGHHRADTNKKAGARRHARQQAG
jgi:hypothetical protein